jgi:CxxC-x17-CxxC domain-containing protein
MKKSKQAKPDIAELINKMQQQLVILEMKIDVLISKSSGRPSETQHAPNPPKPFQRIDQPPRNGGATQDNRFRERILHKAICADCNKECEVPFKPRPDRPVYCKACFSKRKNPNTFKERPDNRPKEENAVHVGHADKKTPVESTKSVEKKKPAAKKRKKRA